MKQRRVCCGVDFNRALDVRMLQDWRHPCMSNEARERRAQQPQRHRAQCCAQKSGLHRTSRLSTMSAAALPRDKRHPAAGQAAQQRAARAGQLSSWGCMRERARTDACVLERE
jgi:hypothetical protein